MSALPPDDIARITDAVAGEIPSLDRTDHSDLVAWIASDPDRAAFARDLRQSRDTVRAERDYVDVDLLAQRVHARIRDTATSAAQPSSRRHRVSDTAGMRRWIVGVTLGAAAVVGGIVTYRSPTQRHAIEHPVSAASSSQYTTQVGQTATLTLADGSRVQLAPNTTLRVAPAFGTNTRTVMLDGEAYFEIQATDGAPFIVHTGVMATRVLGTTFSVRKFATDETVRVAVVQGKVSVSAATPRQPSVTLTAGTVGHVTDSTATSTPVPDMARYIGWASGTLVFREAPVSEILETLTRWYGFQFSVRDSALIKSQLTVGLSTRSSSEALATLQRLLNVDAIVHGNQVTLRSRRTPAPAKPRGRDHIITSHSEVGR